MYGVLLMMTAYVNFLCKAKKTMKLTAPNRTHSQSRTQGGTYNLVNEMSATSAHWSHRLGEKQKFAEHVALDMVIAAKTAVQ
jgi:hypothetical protein